MNYEFVQLLYFGRRLPSLLHLAANNCNRGTTTTKTMKRKKTHTVKCEHYVFQRREEEKKTPPHPH